ncbi:MAG: Serine/threonine-protein kinase PknD [Gemmatimonadaceae bacterium]|nr:Serine/threonine-protein kinase PknD [Gemmatimonadaceae bacterium]
MMQTIAAVGRTLLGRYTVDRELGRGGMAAVFVALDNQTGRYVAIKILDPDLAATLGATRFLREIQVAKSLTHPNILGVLDSGEEDGLLFYVMPLADGESLEGRLRRETQLPIEEAVAIAVQIADALEFAHSKGVLHRDIKPANILLSGKQAFLADFGIAKAVTDAGGEKLTLTGMAIGTPTYMSPEQSTGSRELSPSSDVYALGCVVYEMLTGQPPFTGSTAMALMAKHSLEHVPSIRVVRNSVAGSIEDAVLCALEKVPADRFATAREFADALSGRTHREPPSRTGQRPSIPPPAARSMRPRRLAVAAAALALLAVGGWAAWRFSRGSPAPARIGTDSDPNHIAVLYFDDLSANGELRPLADGFTEALIGELSRVKPFKVISRNGVAAFRDKNVEPDSIGRALKVGTIVSGSVAQSGQHLRVHISVEDALTKAEIGSTTLDNRSRSDLFALQDELASEVARFLRIQVGHEVETLVSRSGSRNSQAWEAMQRAMQTEAGATPLLDGGNVDAARAQLVRADSQLAQVHAMDAKWAAPPTQRAWISYRLARLLGPGDPSAYATNIDIGMGFAQQAVSLAPNDPDALEARAMLLYLRWLLNLAPDAAGSDKLLADAEAGFRASIAANPLQASAWNTLSHLLMAKSQTSQAKLAAQTAYESDPYLTDADRTLYRLSIASLDLGSRVEAEKWCAIGKQRFPTNFRFDECRVWLFAMLGQKPAPDSIWAAVDAYVKASPTNLTDFNRHKGGMIAAIGLIRAGLPDSARAVMVASRANEQLDPTGELTVLEANARAQVGDRDDAIRLLTRYLATNPQQRASAQHDETWWLDPIRDDPRYKALVGTAAGSSR